MNVVLYLRYSSDNQTEQSIEGQRNVCTEYCKNNNLTIIDTYIDRSKSAFKNVEKRTSFLKMISDAEEHKFEGIVVYALDRFARTKVDHAIFQDKLRKCGVTLYSATEHIVGGNETIFVTSMLEAFSEYYSLELSAKVKRGMKVSAEKCQTTGGTPPFGYKVVDKKFVINEIQAEKVKEIFQKYAAGVPIHDIIDELNADGFRNNRGTKFKYATMKSILHNEKYIGVYICNGERIENGIPRIIDDDLFYRVQELSADKKHRSKLDKGLQPFKLSLKLYCRKCGKLMKGDSGTSKSGKIHYYYTCNGHKQHECDVKSIKKDWIEDIVVSRVHAILTPEIVDRIALAVDSFVNSPEKNTERLNLENRIAELKREQSNFVKALAYSTTYSITNRLAEIDNELLDLEHRLNELKLTQAVIKGDDVKEYINLFLNNKLANIDIDKYLINMFVKRVYYSPEQIEIIYNFSDNPPDDEETEPTDYREILDTVEFTSVPLDGITLHQDVCSRTPYKLLVGFRLLTKKRIQGFERIILTEF